MLNSEKTFLPKVSGLARQLPKKGVSNSYFNQRPVSQFAARQRYTAQQVSPPASFERNRLTSQTGIAQAIMPVSANVQPGIRNRIQGLFGGTSSVIASGNPPSGPATPTPRPLQQAVVNQNISARNSHLMDAPIPDSVIQESIITHEQEERKRAADAQARTDAQDPQLQRDIAIAIEASKKSLQSESGSSILQASGTNSGIRAQGLFGNIYPLIASKKLSSNLSATANRPIQDAYIPDSVIQESIRTHQQEEKKRAAEAQAREDAQDRQLQRDMAIAIEASKKSLQPENTNSTSQSSSIKSGSNYLTQTLQRSNLEYSLEQQAISHQKSTVANMLARFGYRFRDVPRDGNCFYHVLAAHYSEQVTCDVMRKAIAGEAWKYFEQYLNDERPYPGFDDDLYKRLLIEGDLNKMLGSGHYGDMTDIIFAARRLQRPIVVVNRDGSCCLAVDRQGNPNLSLSTLTDVSRIQPANTIVMVWDQTIENEPGSNHFMLATR